MKKYESLNHLFLVTFLILSFGFIIFAQESDKTVFTGDLDGNKKAERIVQHKFQKPTKLISRSNQSKYETRNGHFIKYVLHRDGQEKGTTIFEYFIGDDEAVYWVYKIDKVVDLNNDGLKDLIFYAGDDTTNEIVFLLQKSNHFKAIYPGVIPMDMDYWLTFDNSYNFIRKFIDKSPQKIIAKWNAEREVFEGKSGKWLNQNCSIFESLDSQTKTPVMLEKGDFVLMLKAEKQTSENNWQMVENGWTRGWVKTECLTDLSPTRKFPGK